MSNFHRDVTDDQPRLCYDKELPYELYFYASELAVQENPDNAPEYPTDRLLPGVRSVSRFRLAAETGKLWKNGRVLNVRFMDGDPRVHEKVARFVKGWSDYANISFNFNNDPNAEVRISFTLSGSWSYVGTDILAIPKNQPTMNFGWLTPSTANDEVKRVVLHEFGHTLGLIHEHQHPEVGIPWNKEAVYDFYKGAPNYWSKKDVDINLFLRYSASQTQYSDFDRDSIMLYPVANELTQGSFAVGWNKVLSDTDRSFISTLYPRAPKLENELTVGAPATNGQIGERGEVDTYHFKAASRRSYRIETEGRTDVSMSLFGPDDNTRFIVKDDDSGRRLNARLIRTLDPGLYTVRIRHFSKRRTGDYKIFVREER